jgi:hypothetical protein
MSEFKIVNTEIKGNLYIIRDSQYNNLNAVNVTVANNITARLYGNIKGKLIIQKGARVYLHGSVSGKLENLGGELHVFSKT